MRFRFRRFALLFLGTVLTVLLIVFLLKQLQHTRNSGSGRNWPPQNAQSSGGSEIRTNEDLEVRRLLLADAADEAAVAADRSEGASEELAPALLSLFPVGRFPPAVRRNGTGGNELTLNLAIVLVVSLLSIAILITAICCVIIVALALDGSSVHRWSSSSPVHRSAVRSSDLFLSAWPHLASQYHRLNQSPVYRTPGLARLFKQQPEQKQHNYLLAILNDASVDTPPLTDDDDYDDDVTANACWNRLVEEGHCQAPSDGPQPKDGKSTAQPRRKSFDCASSNNFSPI